jgi:hypothetical protein
MTIGKIHYTKHYARERLRNPSEFQKSSFRTYDVGRKGHTKIIIGKLKSTGKWRTQAVLHSRKDYEREHEHKEHHSKKHHKKTRKSKYQFNAFGFKF